MSSLGLLIRICQASGLRGDEAEHRHRCERLAALSSGVHNAYGGLGDIAVELSDSMASSAARWSI